MIITTPEGFKILRGQNGAEQFMIDSERLEKCINYIRKHNLRHIGINSYLGYKSSDLRFLIHLQDFVEGITIPENHFDISVLNELHLLKILGFADNKKSTINLSNFPHLTVLSCEYSSRLASLETCEQLQDLTLTNFRSLHGDLSILPILTSLKALKLFVTNILSLDGIEQFPFLEELSVFKGNRLKKIDCLHSVKDTVKDIEFDECKKITNYDVLSELENLERLLIAKSSPIPSLKFLKYLNKLNFFSFVGTNIRDGDLFPALGIQYVGFDNKKHYNLRFSEFSSLAGKNKIRGEG